MDVPHSPKLLTFLLLITSLVLAGCSSPENSADTSSGTENSTGNGDNTDTNLPSETQTTLRLIEGQVFAAGSGTLEDASVELSLVDDDETEIFSVSTTTNEFGQYLVEVPDYGDQIASQIFATFTREGFSSTETFADVTDLSTVKIDSTLSMAYTTSIRREELEDLAFSADGVPTLRISLMVASDGSKRLLVGDVVPADDEEENLVLNLPVSAIDPEAEVINAQISEFDGAELESFPADSTAQGSVEEGNTGGNLEQDDSDQEPQDMVSTTYFDINLTDENGDPLQYNEDEANASASSQIYIRKYVAPALYERIYTDVDPSREGIQFPFFIKHHNNRTSWQYVGNGTLIDRYGTPIGPNHPSMPVAVASNGAVDLKSATLNGPLFLHIPLNRWSRWVRYINVGYFINNLMPNTATVDMCFNGSVEYGGGDPYSGYLTLKTPDLAYTRVRVNNGTFTLNRTISPRYGDPLALSTWNLRGAYAYGVNYRRPYLRRVTYKRWYRVRVGFFSYRWRYYYATRYVTYYSNEAFRAQNILSATQLTEKQDGCNSINIVFSNPAQCIIDGYVYDEDGSTPLVREPVVLKAGSSSFTRLTNSNGYYRTAAWCNSDYEVESIAKSASFTLSRNNSPYTQNFIDDNRPPLLSLFTENKSRLYRGESTFAKWYVSDPDGDSIELNPSDCESEDDLCSVEVDNAQSRYNLIFPTAGSYSFSVTASDERSDVTRTVSFEVVEPDQNLAPTVQGFEVNGNYVASGGVASSVEGASVSVKAIANDINGDNLSYSWFDADGNALACGSTNQCSFNLNTLGEHSITVEATDQRDGDDSLSGAAAFSLLIGVDEAPEASISLNEDFFLAQAATNIELIQAALTAQDDHTATDDLDVEWTLTRNGVDVSHLITNYFFDDFNLSIPPGTLSYGTYQLSVTVTDTGVNDVAGQSVSDSHSFTVGPNRPPELAITTSSTTLYGTATDGAEESVTLTATYSDEEGVRSFAWTVPEALSASKQGSKLVVSAGSLKPGSYDVVGTVVDTAGQSVSETRTISVETDEPPVINSLTVTPQSQLADINGASTLKVTATVDATDDLSTASVKSWSISPSVAYTANGNSIEIGTGLSIGSYQVQVTVADHRGQTTSTSTGFEVIKRDGNIEVIID